MDATVNLSAEELRTNFVRGRETRAQHACEAVGVARIIHEQARAPCAHVLFPSSKFEARKDAGTVG
jgi:hypothetical protein